MAQVDILIIEDDIGYLELQRFIVSNIQEYNCKIETAKSMEEALSLMKSVEFDLVILDLTLPDSKGINSVKRIKEISTKIPILVVSAVMDEVIKTKALELGVNEFVRKKDFIGKDMIGIIVNLLKKEI